MDGPDRVPGIRPRATLGRRLDRMARLSFPCVVTVLLMLVAVAPFGIPMQAALLPAVALGSAWFWALFRPSSLPPPVVFAIGLLVDLLGYLPLGTGVLTLLIVYGLALRGRRVLARQRFLLVWLAFAGVGTGAAALGWVLTSLLEFRLLPMAPALFQAAVTIAIFPAIWIGFYRAHESVADPARA